MKWGRVEEWSVDRSGRKKCITRRNGRGSWERQGITAFCSCQWIDWLNTEMFLKQSGNGSATAPTQVWELNFEESAKEELRQRRWNVWSRLQDIHYVTIKQNKKGKRTKYSTTPTSCSHILLFQWIYASFPIFVRSWPYTHRNSVSQILCHFLTVHTKTKNQGFTVYTILIKLLCITVLCEQKIY